MNLASIFALISSLAKFVGFAHSVVDYFDNKALLQAGAAEEKAQALQASLQEAQDAKRIREQQQAIYSKDKTDTAFDLDFFR